MTYWETALGIFIAGFITVGIAQSRVGPGARDADASWIVGGGILSAAALFLLPVLPLSVFIVWYVVLGSVLVGVALHLLRRVVGKWAESTLDLQSKALPAVALFLILYVVFIVGVQWSEELLRVHGEQTDSPNAHP